MVMLDAVSACGCWHAAKGLAQSLVALQMCKYATGIDTGCVLGDDLTALVLPSLQELRQKGLATPPAEPVTLEACGGQLVQVKARQVYRRDDADD